MVQILAGSAWTIYGRLKYPLGEMLASRSSSIFHAITQLLGTIMASYTEWERRFLEIEELLKVCFRQILSKGENPLPSTEKIQPSYFFFFQRIGELAFEALPALLYVTGALEHKWDLQIVMFAVKLYV